MTINLDYKGSDFGEIEKLVSSAHKEIEEFFDKKLDNITVRIHQNRKDFDNKLGRKTFDWEIGNTNGNKIDILHPNSFEKYSSHKEEEFLPTLKHEIVHAYLNQLTKNKTIPLWMNEGIANYVSGQVDKYKESGLFIEENFLKKISSEYGWNKYLGYSAYNYSALFIDYLVKKYSFEKVILLVLKADKHYYYETFDTQFKEIFGMSLEKAEKDFVSSLNKVT